MKKALKILLLAIAAYVIYAMVTGVLPFARTRTVKNPAMAADFYADGSACVDRVALVEEPLESLGARVYLLDEAEKTLDISYYAMHMGPSTDMFLAAVLDAADRGVQVRILVDGMSGGLTPANGDYAAALGCHENIDLRLYNRPNVLKPWTLNGRLHDKYIIIDDRLLLLGGRNIGDKYFGPAGFDESLSIDRDVLVYNTAWQRGRAQSVLFDVRSYLDSLFCSADVKPFRPANVQTGAEKRSTLRSLMASAKQAHPDLFVHNTDYEAITFPAGRVSFLHNDIEIGPKAPVVADALGALLRAGRQSVLLQSPYVVLDPALETLLKDLGQQGVTYEILTNSAASSPNLPAYSAYLDDRDKILGTGALVREYQSENAIHAKSYVIDGRMSVVGSYNLDPRSAYIDTELMLAVDSVPFADHLRRTIGTYEAKSLQAQPAGTYRHDPAVEPLPTGGVKQGLLRLLRPLARPFKFLV